MNKSTTNIQKIYVPPLKIQGKKTKLVPFILENIPSNFDTWIEPFMGSGVVGFNAQPKKAIFADNNPHIINFYQAIKNKEITPIIAKDFLEKEGKKLSKNGQEYYNEVREKFNAEKKSLDFLFLNRSCFNGMIRFNKKLNFNVPYGHKPERFAKAYITKIINQIKKIAFLIENNDWTFICQDFTETINLAKEQDFIYCDPPYIGRHVDYYDSWDEKNELDLQKNMQKSNAKFMLSTWHSSIYPQNEYLNTIWQPYHILTTSHFYHLGAKEKNRQVITEAIVTNFEQVEYHKFIQNNFVQNITSLTLFS